MLLWWYFTVNKLVYSVTIMFLQSRSSTESFHLNEIYLVLLYFICTRVYNKIRHFLYLSRCVLQLFWRLFLFISNNIFNTYNCAARSIHQIRSIIFTQDTFPSKPILNLVVITDWLEFCSIFGGFMVYLRFIFMIENLEFNKI